MNQNYNTNYKQFWLNTKLVPSSKPDTQLSFLIDTLKKEIDLEKVETILEVGVGYGRVAKAILEAFPNIDTYVGTDISEKAMDQCWEYLKDYDNFYGPIPRDFEEEQIPAYYDLVISVETMSCLPESYNIQPWIDKMCKLSKKYVVNLDYVKTTHPIFNNGHDYKRAYSAAIGIEGLVLDTPNTDEKLFICRVR